MKNCVRVTRSRTQVHMTRNSRKIQSEIWDLVWNSLEDVSDESGEEDLGNGYLLKYEGWGGVCVEKVWANVESEQEKTGIDTKSEESKEEREQACYEYAEEQSHRIIDDEWKPELKEMGCRFIAGGYDNGGLYGKAWALFKRNV